MCFTDGCEDPPPDTKKGDDGIEGVPKGLNHLPRPEPDLSQKDDHDAWVKEHEEWGQVRCAGTCKKGYFCRQHGAWITGQEVATGVAASADAQAQGQDTCPTHHYNDQLSLSLLKNPGVSIDSDSPLQASQHE